MTPEQSNEAKQVLRRAISVMASELATIELIAARTIAKHRGGVLVFPWNIETPKSTRGVRVERSV